MLYGQQRALRSNNALFGANNALFGANQQRNYIGGIERHDVTYPPLPADGLAKLAVRQPNGRGVA